MNIRRQVLPGLDALPIPGEMDCDSAAGLKTLQLHVNELYIGLSKGQGQAMGQRSAV